MKRPLRYAFTLSTITVRRTARINQEIRANRVNTYAVIARASIPSPPALARFPGRFSTFDRVTFPASLIRDGFLPARRPPIYQDNADEPSSLNLESESGQRKNERSYFSRISYWHPLLPRILDSKNFLARVSLFLLPSPCSPVHGCLWIFECWEALRGTGAILVWLCLGPL